MPDGKADRHLTALLCRAARCIDQYVEQRVKGLEQGEEPEIDPRLTAIVERMFDRRATSRHMSIPSLPPRLAGVDRRGALAAG